MDMKELMQGIKKHSFWLVTGLVIVVFVAGWYLSTKQLKAETATYKSQIDTGFSAVSSVITSNANHPNDHSHQKMDELVEQLKQNLLDAWELQYNRQKDLLVWPKELGDDFLADIDRLLVKNGQRNPIETITYPSEEIQHNLQRHLLEQYQLFATTQVPPLAEIIRSNWEGDKPANEAGGNGDLAGFGEASQSGPATQSKTLGPPPIISWDSNSQSSVLARFKWARTPTTMQVLYAQEDLWVLTQIMQVLQEVNKDALVPSKAVITELINLEVGRNAADITEVGQVLNVDALKSASLGGGGDGMDDMGMDDMEGMEAGMDESADDGGIDSSSGGQTSGTTGSTAAAASPHPANLRYVDNALQRLDAQRLQAAVAPGPNPPLETIYLAVAKRYPIRLRIKMDLTKLPDLLTACGNAKLPIEILQVSINGSAGRSGGGGAGGAMGEDDAMQDEMFGEDMFGGEEDGAMMEDDMFGGKQASTAERLLLTNFPYEEEVELYGVVYIYNPVNIEKLGITPKEPVADNEQPAVDNNAPAP